MTADKLKQYIALFGGLLSAILLFLGTLNVQFDWFNTDSIDAFVGILMAMIPFVLLVYGVYKNTYVVTKQARYQEKVLKDKGLK